MTVRVAGGLVTAELVGRLEPTAPETETDQENFFPLLPYSTVDPHFCYGKGSDATFATGGALICCFFVFVFMLRRPPARPSTRLLYVCDVSRSKRRFQNKFQISSMLVAMSSVRATYFLSFFLSVYH